MNGSAQPVGDPLGSILARWEEEADLLRQRGAGPQAEVLLSCARELADAIRESAAELLTLQQAARVSGFSPDHLRRLVKQRRLVDYGRFHAPRFRRGDLPRKSGPLPDVGRGPTLVGATPRQIAAALLKKEA